MTLVVCHLCVWLSTGNWDKNFGLTFFKITSCTLETSAASQCASIHVKQTGINDYNNQLNHQKSTRRSLTHCNGICIHFSHVQIIFSCIRKTSLDEWCTSRCLRTKVSPLNDESFKNRHDTGESRHGFA